MRRPTASGDDVGWGGPRTTWPATGDAAADWLLGQAGRRLREGFPDAALPCLDRALHVLRDEALIAEVHVVVAELLRDRDEHAAAAAHLRAASGLAPGRADVLYRLGRAHAQQENLHAAVEALRQAAALAPDEPQVLRLLATCLAGTGKDAAAHELLLRALVLAPDDIHVLEAVASHDLKTGRFAECGAILQRAATIAPDNRLVRRLSKETTYLVELASRARQNPPAVEPRRRVRLVLEGAAGEVEQTFMERMEPSRFTEAQRLNACDLWRDYLAARAGRFRGVDEHAAAVHFLIARMDFVDGCGPDDVARRHGVSAAALRRIYHDMVHVLGIGVFDRRYCTQPHPVEQVGGTAEETGLQPDEIFRALLEDEYREYEEMHDRSAAPSPRLERDAFEDASVEYGGLLTREMMGLQLSRRERVRKRELERLLMVT